MKKVLVILLVLIVAAGAFAQVNGYGRARVNFGTDLTLAPEDVDPTWHFLPHFRLGLRGGNDTVSFFGQGDFNTNADNAHVYGTWRANATVKINEDFSLSIGRNELPWVQWSSLAFYGDNNHGFGSSSSNVVGYFHGSFAGAYLGLTSAGKVHAKSIPNAFPMPGFYLGYDLKDEAFSVGGAFAGLLGKYKTAGISADPDADPPIIGVDPEDYDVFSWMGNVHAKFFLDPLTLGVNVALYGAPTYGFFALPNGGGIIGGKDALVLEAMLDAGIKLEPCTIGLSAAMVMNMADKDEKGGGGSALRLGASANFDIGGGFRVIPGLMYTNYLKGVGGNDIDNSTLAIGVTLLYSF